MREKVLFSPIGGSDPIRDFYDGPMLHICRYYRPDIVYMYLSKEMYEHHQKDDRFVYCLKKLGEEIGHEFKIELIERPELVNVHLFDYFVKEFEVLLRELTAKHLNAEYLINISSGTPAMKSALQLLDVMAEFRGCSMTMIQVVISTGKGSTTTRNGDDYDPQAAWENNMDNEITDNRCLVSEDENLSVLSLRVAIRQLVLAGDYAAARSLCAAAKLNEGGKKLLDAAYYRSQLNLSAYTKALGSEKDFRPILDSEYAMTFEYLLSMKLKLQRGEYADFIRACSPVVFQLFQLCAERSCKRKLSEFTFKKAKRDSRLGTKERSREVLMWDNDEICGCEELQAEVDAQFRNGMNEEVNSAGLELFIRVFARDVRLAELCSAIRGAEEKVRNVAAHELTLVNAEKIEQSCGITPEKLMDYLFSLCAYAGISAPEEARDSYRQMNEAIIAQI